MEDQAELLARIATALEKLVPAGSGNADWLHSPAYVWDGSLVRPVHRIEAPALSLLRGIDRQKHTITENIARLAKGTAAHDMLLWGARGMGKSAVLRSAVAESQAEGGSIALVQVATGSVPSLPTLFAQLAEIQRNFLVFIDDLGFSDGDDATPRHLRSWLDGGVEARPSNVRLAVTSNRRAILLRQAAEQNDSINPRDSVDDNLALADRFGLALGFHNASQDDYLDMLRGYASEYGLDLDEPEALEWAKRRGARSGRIAWHFITELAGRAGKQV